MFKLSYIALVIIGFIDLQFMLGLPSWIYFMQPQTMLTEHLPTDTSARESLWKSLRTVLNNAVLTWDVRIQQQQPTEQMGLYLIVYFLGNFQSWGFNVARNQMALRANRAKCVKLQTFQTLSMSENCAGWDSKPSCSLFFFLIKIFFIYFGCAGSSLLCTGFSLVVTSRDYSSLLHVGFSLWWALLLQSTGSRHAGVSSFCFRALEHGLNSCSALT